MENTVHTLGDVSLRLHTHRQSQTLLTYSKCDVKKNCLQYRVTRCLLRLYPENYSKIKQKSKVPKAKCSVLACDIHVILFFGNLCKLFKLNIQITSELHFFLERIKKRSLVLSLIGTGGDAGEGWDEPLIHTDSLQENTLVQELVVVVEQDRSPVHRGEPDSWEPNLQPTSRDGTEEGAVSSSNVTHLYKSEVLSSTSRTIFFY